MEMHHQLSQNEFHPTTKPLSSLSTICLTISVNFPFRFIILFEYSLISIINDQNIPMHPYRHNRLGQNRNLTNLAPSHHKQPVPSCRNHPDKIATHYLISSEVQEQLNYCEKCSIMLASQNFNVLKIHHDKPSPSRPPHKSERQVEVEYFLREVAQQIEQIQQKASDVQNVLRNSEESYTRVLAQITGYFKQIETIVEIQKYTAYNTVLSERGSVEAELRTLRDSISVELQGLVSISNDIENNMEAVLSVEPEVYETIMQNYSNKLEMATEIEQLEVNTIIEPTCLLPDIPKALYSLAEGLHLRNNYLEPTPSPKRVDLSFKHSLKSSRGTTNRLEELCRPSSSLPSVGDLYRKSSQGREQPYSFDNGATNAGQMQRVLFLEAAQKKLMPHEVAFRQSLNLTEIRENEEQLMMRRFTSLQETIPQEMQSSRQSIEAYLMGSSEQEAEAIPKGDSRAEDTQTLLIS